MTSFLLADHRHIGLVASNTDKAQRAMRDARATLQNASNATLTEVSVTQAHVIVAFGGDGFVLDVLQNVLQPHQYLYALNRGTLGFLTNDFRPDIPLATRLEHLEVACLQPLLMNAINKDGGQHERLAFNDVALFRQTHQVSKIRVSLDGIVRLDPLVGDGIVVATPAGSTAYNYSARGPVLPLEANVLTLTPLNPFRPRGWRGVVVSAGSVIDLEILNITKRPVAAVADSSEVRHVQHVSIRLAPQQRANLLFDQDAQLNMRLIAEGFAG